MKRTHRACKPRRHPASPVFTPGAPVSIPGRFRRLAPSALVALGLMSLIPRAQAAFPANLELSSLDGTTGFKLSGVAGGDSSGRSVSEAGDINGDGVADLVIGAYIADPNGSDSGASYVVFGKDTATAGAFPANSSPASTAPPASSSRGWRPVTTRASR